MPTVFVELGCVMLAIAFFFWREGSGWGLFIAWVFGTWGAMLVAWGLLAGWHRSLAACIAGSTFALAAVLVALLYVQREAWELAIPCVVGGALAFIFGAYRVGHILRSRT